MAANDSQVGEVYGLKRKIMTKEELINKIWDCYIDIHNSCGMITDEEAMQKSIKLLDEYELSKLHQPDVMQRSEQLPCERCKKLEFMIENGLGWKDMKNDCT